MRAQLQGAKEKGLNVKVCHKPHLITRKKQAEDSNAT